MAALVEDHECFICMVAYTEERPPKILPCGHSFCPPCLGTWCSTNATCPTCKQPHNLRSAAADSLPTNYGLLGVAQRAEEAARMPQCQQHQKPRISRCIDCKKDLCLQCLMHYTSTGDHNHKGHKVISMDELSSFIKSEVSKYEAKVNKAYQCLLEKNKRDVEVFQIDIDRLKSKVNSDVEEAIKKINDNRKDILLQLATRSKEALETVQKYIRKIHDELERYREEISSSTSQITDENLVNVQEKATALEEIVSSFESSAYFPKIDINGEVSVKLATLSIEEPPSPPTLPALSALSLGPASPPTQRVPSQEQPKACGQSDDLAASSTEPSSPTPASNVSLPYRQYASHGSFRVRGEPGAVIHLCSTGNMSCLVEEMRPPPDAVVWCSYWDYTPPPMPLATETISVLLGWDEAVWGISQAERNQRRAVAVRPDFDSDDEGAITPLLHHITSGRQHRADHIIVVDYDEDRMTEWQQQLEEDTRLIRLQ